VIRGPLSVAESIEYNVTLGVTCGPLSIAESIKYNVILGVTHGPLSVAEYRVQRD